MTSLAVLLLTAAGSLVAPPALAATAKSRSSAREVVRLEVLPKQLELSHAPLPVPYFVTAVRRDGSREDVTDQAQVRVPGGLARVALPGRIEGAHDGAATAEVRFGALSANLPVRVSGSASPRPISFQFDVLPVMSRAGCNQGTCHGNGEGRGGLKLSLKGEDPARDYEILTEHGAGRRVNRTEPGRSLILLKATSTVPHGGGLRFKASSVEYRTLAGWIAEGAKFDPPSAPRLERLEVLPREVVLREPARQQRLQVLGHFTDGSVRDLSCLSVYNCGDPALEVRDDGSVTAQHSADAAVLVRYADRMENARITVIPARPGFVWSQPAAFNWIDEVNFRRLKLLRLNPSRLTSNSEFLRRSTLDAIGRLPSAEEARAFLGDPSPDKRSRWIDALLARPEFADYWTLKWSDVLRLEERSLDATGGKAYRDWIHAAITNDKPMDQFARELLMGTGSTYQSPPANYYRRTRTPIELAETTAQLFMGSRLLCAKCHNHPTERWKQQDFYTIAAFFSHIERKGELTRKDKFDKHELQGEEFIGVGGKEEVQNPRTGKVVPPRLETLAIPQPPSAQPDATGAADRREPFVRWLTAPENPFFARAMVNRVWYHLFGKGIVDPVDDLRDSNPASNPELLDHLAAELVKQHFQFRPLVRLIMNSRTYQLASEANDTNREDERFFSRGIPRRLPAEVLLDAVSDVTAVPEKFAGMPVGTRAVQMPPIRAKSQFLLLFGQPSRESVCECERTDESTLGQSFALIGGHELNDRLQSPQNRLGKLIAAGKDDRTVIEEVYLAALSRRPTEKELAGECAYVRSKPDRRAALEDLLWALLNSKEFLLRR